MTVPPNAVDLHVHSRASGDNDADPEECVVRAVERGLSAIAFAEHYSYGASEPVERLAEKYRGEILVLRGVEFSARDGHCLVFGVDTDRLSLRDATAEELTRVVRGEGGIVVPAHPYRGANSLDDRVLALQGIAALEGYNGCSPHALNLRAIEAARRLGIPFTGGSDAHAPGEVGSCFTVFDEPVTAENFLDLLRAGRFRGVDTRKISRGLPFP